LNVRLKKIFAKHQEGNLKEAKKDYLELLESEPANSKLNFLIGSLYFQEGNPEEAISYLQKALAINPSDHQSLNNLGLVYQALGNYDYAVNSFHRAINLKNDYIHAYNNLSVCYHTFDHNEKAINVLEDAIKIEPENPETNFNIGILNFKEGSFKDAEKYLSRAVELAPNNPVFVYNLAILQIELNQFRNAQSNLVKALKLSPNNSEIMFNLGYLSEKENNLDKAINFYKAAIEVNKNFAEAHFNLGNIYKQKENWEEARLNFNKTTLLKKDHYKALNNLGYVYHKEGNYKKAIEYYKKSIEKNSEYLEAYINYGSSLLELGDIGSSIKQYDYVIENEPGNRDAHFNKAVALLLKGDFEKGFAEYEYRSKDKIINKNKIWNGENLTNKTLLIHDEQGAGDTVQIIRFLHLIKNADTKIILRCREELIPLFKELSLIDHLISFNEELYHKYDFEIQLLSLPYLLKTTVDTIPVFQKYLVVNDSKVDEWKNKLIGSAKPKIGFAWKGNPKHKYDFKRSVDVELFEGLFNLEKFDFYSLQIDTNDKERKYLSKFKNIHTLENELNTFEDTAAVIQNLDLIITIDTSIVHIAGALGKKTWVLLPHIPDWRWLQNRDDSPWYPTLKLFRQKNIGEWKDLFKEVEYKLTSEFDSENDTTLLKIKAFEAHTKDDLISAEHFYKELLEENPEDDEINFWLGKLYIQQNRLDKAVPHLEISFSADSTNKEYSKALKEVYTQLANDLIRKEKFEEANAVFEKLIQLKVNEPDVYNNYGYVLQVLQKYDEAKFYIRKAVELKSDPKYLAALANNYYFQGNHLKAISLYDEALENDPENFNIRFHKGMVHLLLEDYETGWNYYSYRSYENKFLNELDNKKLWDGKSYQNKTLAVFAEQGFGDTILFSRFVLLVKNKFDKVLFFVQPELYNLFKDFSKEIEIFPFDKKSVQANTYDFYIPLLEIPRLLKVKTQTIPANTPYLQASTGLVNKWKKIINNESKVKVGLVWRGNQKNTLNRRRFLSLNDYLQLFKNEDIDFYILQYDLTNDEKKELKKYKNAKVLGNNSFEDGAAVISLLDLVITPDTYSVHLAGALNIDTYLLLENSSDWKWLLNREDSPWYSSLNLFRRKSNEGWQDVVGQVNVELQNFVQGKATDLSGAIEFARKFIDQNRIDKAINEFNKILSNNFNSVDALFYLGYCYHLKNDLVSAYENYSKVINLDPVHYNAYNNLGIILKDYGKFNEAEKCFNISIKIKKDNPTALNNLGIIHDLKGEFEKAISSFKEAVEYNNNYAEAYLNLANSYQALNNEAQALASINKTLEINPFYVDAHFNKSLILLKSGNLKDGLVEYEWRKRKDDYPRRKFSKPELFEQDVKNKTIFVYDEQGFGDTFQFVRYLYKLKKQGAHIIFECHNSLYDLMKNIEAVDAVMERVSFEEPDVYYDYHISLLSLPLYFNATINNIPNTVPYLSPGKELVKQWRDFLLQNDGLKVGIVWEGKKPLHNAHRASSLNDFMELLKIENVEFFSLQVGDVAQKNKELVNKYGIKDLSQYIKNFNTTASIISNLDLVITVDTSVAHLSGALNVPTWTLLSSKADWRWFTGTEESIWYPSMKLYRQKEFGSWTEVINRVSNDLRKTNNNYIKQHYKELKYGL
jgi:tetratricopeptide (TPR) repeat protein